MLSYIIRRLLGVIPVMLVVGIFVFSLLHLAPGDPAAIIAGDNASEANIAQIRTSLGLDRPLLEQFTSWGWATLRGDLGVSMFSQIAVTTLIGQRVGPTFSLAVTTMLVAVTIAVTFGVLAAWRAGSWLDRAVMGAAVMGFSVPVFVVGYILVYFVALKWRWLPVQGYTLLSDGFWPWLQHLILPSIALGLAYVALIARITRASMLDVLADNPTQKGIKAIFFLQTRSSDGGATQRGRALIVREHAEGHVLALHDGSPWGHRSHRNLNDAELEKSLRDGVADLNLVSGRAVTLVRPPYWAYDARTLAAYARHGLSVLLTDISANDGKDWGFKASPRRFIHMANEMWRVRDRIERNEIPVVDGVMPIVVTFHDTNDYTAVHMQEYLQMIVDQAQAAGLTLAARPFYDETSTLERAALARASAASRRADMVPWWWRWMQW